MVDVVIAIAKCKDDKRPTIRTVRVPHTSRITCDLVTLVCSRSFHSIPHCFFFFLSSCIVFSCSSTFASNLLCFTYNEKNMNITYSVCRLLYVASVAAVVLILNYAKTVFRMFCLTLDDFFRFPFFRFVCFALPSHESMLFAYFRLCRSAFSSFWLIHVVVGHLISCDKYAPRAFSLTLKRFAWQDDDVYV